MLFVLLSLGLVLVPLGSAVQTAAAQSAGVTLDAKWLVLRKEDVSPQQVQIPDRVSEDGRAQLTVRRFQPDWKNQESHPPVPDVTIDTLWLAKDVETARQIFQEQIEAGFPDAPGAVHNVGEVDLPSLGEEARGIGGCGPCDGTLHFRIVFRYLNAVHALYIYGPDAYAYREVAVNWAIVLNERVHASPAGPAPDVARTVAPRAVALTIADVGKEIDFIGDQEGSDDRAQWYQSRFKRTLEKERSHLGPLDIYDKVWVARDIETASAIFAEQARPGMPEAEQTVGTQFPMDRVPGVGNDNFGWSACNESCMTEFYRYLHHRYVLRSGNVVIVLYLWGGTQDTSIEQVTQFAQSMRNRIP